MISKIFFIISDIHGHFDEMIDTLEKNGYDNDNPKHHLIVIGDMFDRGTQSKEVLEYLYPLCVAKKATVVLGNHEKFLIELLDEKYLRAIFNIRHNGTDKTLTSLLQNTYIVGDELKDVKMKIDKKYPFLNDWLKSLPSYLEIGDYIFVHGGINGGNKDWKKQPARDFIWNRQKTLKPVEGKTMVVGHHRAATIRYPGVNYKKLFLSNPDAFGILYEDKKIYIDSFVEISKFINVLILNID